MKDNINIENGFEDELDQLSTIQIWTSSRTIRAVSSSLGTQDVPKAEVLYRTAADSFAEMNRLALQYLETEEAIANEFQVEINSAPHASKYATVESRPLIGAQTNAPHWIRIEAITAGRELFSAPVSKGLGSVRFAKPKASTQTIQVQQ